MRYYVVSDTHGFFTYTMEALQNAKFFDDKKPHKLIMLGDIMDRGKESVEMQRFVLQEMEKDEIILVRGNHEDLFSMLVNEDRGMDYEEHLDNGTYDTALQLTGFEPIMARIHHYDFADKAKETPFYKKIMPAMMNYFETDHYVFVHGWIPSVLIGRSLCYNPDWRNASKKDWESARWLNGMDMARVCNEEKMVVCGHWHASYGHAVYEGKGTQFGEEADFSPYHAPHVIAIDACTAYSHKVNCLVLED